MTEAYKTFQQLILKSEGKTLQDELEFGCLGEDNEGKIWKYVGVGDLDWVNEEGGYSLTKCKILGLPITLERVLMAFGGSYFTLNGSYKKNEIIIKIGIFSIDWKLCKVAHLQSEETLQALINILK